MQRAKSARADDSAPAVRLPVGDPVSAASDRAPVERGGGTESKAAAEIEDLAAAGMPWTSECARLEDQALTAARVIDTVIADGRVHLAPAHFRLLNDALERLRGVLAVPVRQDGREEDAGHDGLPFPSWLQDEPAMGFLGACNVGWFPRDDKGTHGAVQRVCTLPRGHEGPHGDGAPN